MLHMAAVEPRKAAVPGWVECNAQAMWVECNTWTAVRRSWQRMPKKPISKPISVETGCAEIQQEQNEILSLSAATSPALPEKYEVFLKPTIASAAATKDAISTAEAIAQQSDVLLRNLSSAEAQIFMASNK